MISRYKAIVFLLIAKFFPFISGLPRFESSVQQVTIQTNGYAPLTNDDYVAVSLAVKPGYIVRFQPFADAYRVHHILLYGCEYPAESVPFWRGFQTCRGRSHILYAWAKNAPDLRLPQDVAFSVGHKEDAIRFLVLQVHYSHPFLGKVLDYSGVTVHMTNEKPRNLAAVLLFVSSNPIPPGLSHFQTNISCFYSSDTPIHPFAFRTHTHRMGRVVSAFYKNSNKWTLIGKRNPQWPQLFQPIQANLTISSGDLVAATCVFDSSMQESFTEMGSRGSDEMCNFYMMFYWDAATPDPFPYGAVCDSQEEQQLVSAEYPVEGITLFPSNLDWKYKAFQSNEVFGVSEGIVTAFVSGIKLGQVSAVSFDSFGNLIIFHRANRIWDENSFDSNNLFINQKPIADDVILVAQTNESYKTLSLLSKYGSGKFYMPHGLTVDRQNNYYTTDVGSHQVIKWTISQGSLTQVFALGEKFVPGSDHKHFCKPAGIAVTIDGSIYVADGYCNNRIIKFNRNGNFEVQWGQSNSGLPTMEGTSLGVFSLPHDIVTNDDGSLLYIADRENARIQIFRSDGHPVGQIVNPVNSTAFRNVYSVHYHNNLVYFVSGESQKGERARVFVAHAEAAQVQYSFEPTGYQFNRPHTIRVTPDGRYIYIGELGQNAGQILQFEIHPASNEFNGQSSTGFLSTQAQLTVSPFPISLVLLVAVVALPVISFYVFKRRKIMQFGKQQSVLDRAGFKALRTDDPDSSSTDSEDDTILAKRRGNFRF